MELDFFSSASDFQSCSKNEVYRYPTPSIAEDVIFLPSSEVLKKHSQFGVVGKVFPGSDKKRFL